MSDRRASLSLVSFLLRVNSNAYRLSPVHGVVGIIFSIAKRLCMIVAFLLPLKVILLAANPGVPRYFAGLITDETRGLWIASLAGGTVLFYLLGLAVDHGFRRLADAFGSRIIDSMNLVHKRADEREKASQNCRTLLDANGAVLTAVIGLAVIFWLNPALFSVLLALILVVLIFTVSVLRTRSKTVGVFKNYILNNFKQYTQIASFIIFVIGFFTLLLPFFMGDGGNALIAVITFIILRQLLSGLETSVNNYANLFFQRSKLAFLTKAEPGLSEHRQLGTNFDRLTRDERDAWLRRALTANDPEAEFVSCVWIDPASPHERDFELQARGPTGEKPYRMRIALHGARHVIANEELLSRFNGAHTSLCVPIRSRAVLDEKTCTLYDMSGLAPIAAADQKDFETEFLLRSWSYPPPQDLIAAYRRSHAEVAQRFTPELSADLREAVDDEGEEALLVRFDTVIPVLHNRLAHAPRYIHFDRQRADWLRIDASARPRTLYPGNWRIEPIGIHSLSSFSEEALSAAVERVRAARHDLSPEWGPADIRLVDACSRLIRLVRAKKLKEAHGMAATIVALLDTPDDGGFAIS